MKQGNPIEADTVRKIFELSRAGKGTERICRVLNADGAPAPRAQRGRPVGWVPSSVGSILRRSIYRGVLVWGKGQKRDKWGATKYSKRPETDWLTVEVPHLRIVSDELWNETHERMRASRQTYLRTTDGKLWGKPANGVESKYLLTGMAVCAECGGGLQHYSRSHGRKGASFYGCPRAHVDRCSNTLEVRMEIADAAALGIVSDDVLSPTVVTRTLDKLMAKFDAPEEDVAARRARITAAQAKVAKELANLSAAVARGDDSDTLVSAIRERERRQKELAAELAALDAGPDVLAQADGVRAEALRRLDDWRGLLGQNVAVSRQLLRKLLGATQRFVFYPKGQGERRWYELGVTPTLDRFFEGLPVLKKAVASLEVVTSNRLDDLFVHVAALRQAGIGPLLETVELAWP